MSNIENFLCRAALRCLLYFTLTRGVCCNFQFLLFLCVSLHLLSNKSCYEAGRELTTSLEQGWRTCGPPIIDGLQLLSASGRISYNQGWWSCIPATSSGCPQIPHPCHENLGCRLDSAIPGGSKKSLCIQRGLLPGKCSLNPSLRRSYDMLAVNDQVSQDEPLKEKYLLSNI